MTSNTQQKNNLKNKGAQKRILLVEDDELISRACVDGLKKAGYEVDLVRDGVTAARSIKQNPPDLILLDLMLPQMPGEWVMQSMNKNEITKSIPVIILSAKGDDASIGNCLRMGAKDYLVKSNFSLAKIIEKISQYLKG